MAGRKVIQESLEEQLNHQGKDPAFYHNLVDDYMRYWDLKQKLIQDIKQKGLRYETTNGNGFTIEKANESVDRLPKVTAIMLKILHDLNLKEPVTPPEGDEDGYL